MTQADELGAELNERTGHFPMPIFTAARLQWLKNSSRSCMDKSK